jgi:dGTPase
MILNILMNHTHHVKITMNMNQGYLYLRPDIEKNEQKILAPYAVFAAESEKREYEEKPDAQRTCFQRDRDRVIHCAAYRRLKGKTQVFVAHHGDHFRNRLTHTMEVAQLARDLTRNLGGNEDLAETIALAHDLGHTPFGHAGQQAMQELLHRYNLFFEHNQQSRRIVEKLENKSPAYPGLNLTDEVRDGMVKHRKADYQDAHIINTRASLEAQIVDIADQIAYQNHDIDDGLRSGIFTLEELEKVDVWREAIAETNAYLPEKEWTSQIISTLIKIMSGNMLYELHAASKVSTPKTRTTSEKQNFPLRHFLQIWNTEPILCGISCIPNSTANQKWWRFRNGACRL